MARSVHYVRVFLLLCLALLLGDAFGQKAADALPIEHRSSCAARMRDVIASAQGSVYDYEGAANFTEPEAYYLVEYSIHGDALTNPVLENVPPDLADEQADTGLQYRAWEIFAQMIPAQDRRMLAQFNIFTDGYSNTLAAVDQSTQDTSLWILEVDIADLEDRAVLLFTLVHEYAHLFTLEAAQVIPDVELIRDPYNLVLQTEKTALCPNYFTGYGCSYEDSYIHVFHQRFWADIDDEWRDADALQYQSENQVPYYNALYAFFKSHRDQFVDDYAVTHPTEDIAESFAYFVFSPQPPGDSIRERKVRFFYKYPELIRLRSGILNAVCKPE